MSYMKFAEWLVVGATDEEFAEFFVRMYKVWKGATKSPGLNYLEMRNAPIDEITNWINKCLHEIIESEDECASAWWKQKGE